jgi:hypothetical protein
MDAGLLKSGQKYQDLLPASTSQAPAALKTVLSKELQLYNKKISESIFSTLSEIQEAAFSSISNDPGLQPLLPHLVLLLTTQITKNLNDQHILTSCLSTISCLFKNPNLFIDPYVCFLLKI